MRNLCAVAILGALIAPLAFGPASAADFMVEPVVMTLPAKGTTQITVTNRDNTTVNFQVRGFKWDESVDGKTDLAAAPDLVYFPKQFALKPGEGRKIRLGVNTAPGPKERSYRLFIEELPPASVPNSAGGEHIVVRTQVGLAVFTPATTATTSATLGTPAATANRLTVSVVNNGTVHILLKRVHVTAKDKAGSVLLNAELPGWYVLPGNTRAFAYALPAGACAKLGSVTVDASSDRTALVKTFDSISAGC